MYARPSARFGHMHGRVYVFARMRGRRFVTHVVGRARDSVVRGARLGRDVCAHGRVHGPVVTHGMVVHGLNFLWMIRPCG